MRTIPCVVAAVLLLGVAAGGWAGELSKAASGREAGSDTPPFTVASVTGPYKGKSLCYI